MTHVTDDVLTTDEVEEILTDARTEKLAGEAVHAAYSRAGLADDFGLSVPDKLRRAVMGLLIEDPVRARNERAAKAQTAHALTQRIFPDVPAPGTEEYEDGGQVAERVWSKLEGAVWRATDPKASSSAQKLLARMGEEGLVLVRTTIAVGTGTMNATMAKAAYVTADGDSLMKDYAKPLREKVNKVAEAMAKDLGMVAERNPELAELLMREIKASMKGATDLAVSTLALSVGDEKP